MEYKAAITADEVQENIVIPNTEWRTYIAKKENTGYDEDQVFTNEVFPKEISGIFIGFTEIDSKVVIKAITISLKLLMVYVIVCYIKIEMIFY